MSGKKSRIIRRRIRELIQHDRNVSLCEEEMSEKTLTSDPACILPEPQSETHVYMGQLKVGEWAICTAECSECEVSHITWRGVYKPQKNCATVDRDPKTFKVIHPD
jgi:hypothetical protein